MTTVAVFFGGVGPERDVSLASGRAVMEACAGTGWTVCPVEVTRDGDFVVDRSILSPPCGIERLRSNGVEAVVVALHGPFGEDGILQGFLTASRMPFTGPGVECAALAMNKHAARLVLADGGIRVPSGRMLRRGDAVELSGLVPPVVVKPCRLGSSVGVAIVPDALLVKEAVEATWDMGQDCLVEEFIAGTEYSCPVRDTLDGPQALPVVEIRPRAGRPFFDYTAKYAVGQADEVVHTAASPLTETLRSWALACHRLLGCRSFSRTDFIVRDGAPFVLEINTVPGMTAQSLLPRCAAAAGITMADLVTESVHCALRDRLHPVAPFPSA